MKRSRSIRLVLIGGLTAGAAAGCGPSGGSSGGISPSNVYTNNHFVEGVGYYHAPFRAWYPQPYNLLDPQTGRYFQGGQWLDAPHASITNLSSPSSEALERAYAVVPRPDTRRGGFGSTSHHRTFLS